MRAVLLVLIMLLGAGSPAMAQTPPAPVSLEAVAAAVDAGDLAALRAASADRALIDRLRNSDPETLIEFQLAARHVVDAGQDDRVQHDDVGHRDESDYAAADLVGERGPSLRDLEEAVEAVHSSTLRGVAHARDVL